MKRKVNEINEGQIQNLHSQADRQPCHSPNRNFLSDYTQRSKMANPHQSYYVECRLLLKKGNE